MTKNKAAKKTGPKPPSVRIARPKRRPIQLRYLDPESGKEIRISTGTYNEDEAADEKKRLEAELLLGISRVKERKVSNDESMPWDYFREKYRRLHLVTLRESSIKDAEWRLDIAEKVFAPKTIGDIFNTEALSQLQSDLLEGKQSRRNKPRSRYTVKAYMTDVRAAAKWAFDQGWLKNEPKLKILKVAKIRGMRGRPITEEEFKSLLGSVEKVVGTQGKDEWQRLLNGLWQSGLRLTEILNLGWEETSLIYPVWAENKEPVLKLSAEAQKNDTEEEIPLLPWFENILLETPKCDRKGYVFNPTSLHTKHGSRQPTRRPSSAWVGKVISAIGKESGIIVRAANKKTGAPQKYISAHDLRRSCGQRLLGAGVPPLVISRVLRHTSWQTTQNYYVPGSIQNDAKVLRSCLDEEQKELPKS